MPDRERSHVIAAGDRATAEVARELLWLGGNAFDAAAGAVFASMVAEPTLTGAGGGGHLLACPVGRRPVLFDFFVDMPSGAVAGGELDFFPITVDFGDAQQDFWIGRGAAAVPGCLAGLLYIQKRLGRLAGADLLAPAARLARRGVRLSPTQAYLVELLAPILTRTAPGRALFAPQGRALRTGELFRNPEFGDFLEELAREGSSLFYRGEVARRLVAWSGSGGLIRARDLEGYRVRERPPLEVPFRGYRLLFNPPPAQSGLLLRRTFALLEQGGASLEELVGALERTEEARPGLLPGSTTQVSILDAAGNAASVTTTNGEGCGSLVPGCGIMLNNMLGEEDLNPRGFHRQAPGTRLGTMLAPTVVLEGERPVLVTGSSGSKRIRSAVTQVIVNVLCRGMDITGAVQAPRIHLEGDTVHAEPGVEEGALERLARRYRIRRWKERNLFFGGANSVTPRRGAGDPRRGGWALRPRAASSGRC